MTKKPGKSERHQRREKIVTPLRRTSISLARAQTVISTTKGRTPAVVRRVGLDGRMGGLEPCIRQREKEVKVVAKKRTQGPLKGTKTGYI